MVNFKVILSVTGGAWGYLFDKEERVEELERFKNNLANIKENLPKDLNLEVHSFEDASEEVNFVSSLNEEDIVIYCGKQS